MLRFGLGLGLGLGVRARIGFRASIDFRVTVDVRVRSRGSARVPSSVHVWAPKTSKAPCCPKNTSHSL